MDLAELGIPLEDEMIERYCQHTDTPDVTDWSFYLAFTFFRVAAILQGVYKRALQSKGRGSSCYHIIHVYTCPGITLLTLAPPEFHL